MTRPSYRESVLILKNRVEIIGDALPEVTRNPRHDDEVLGPGLFRMMVDGAAFDDLTLPGFYVGRTELRNCSFRNADLRLSTFNWSDLLGCDFTHSDLSDADLRACRFVSCVFAGTTLRRADLRRSSFERCNFADADFAGAVLHRSRKWLGLVKTTPDQESLPLSKDQRRSASWSDAGAEPGGGHA